jgi:hypothetical protein
MTRFKLRLAGQLIPGEAPAGNLDLDKYKAEAIPNRYGRVEDLYWTLINTTEFSWNH